MRSNYCPPARNNGSKVIFGIILLCLGVLFLLKRLHLIPPLHFHDVWPFVVLFIGLLIGVRNGFRNAGSWILIAIGVAHLIPTFDFMVGDNQITSRELAAPALLIGLGIIIILNNRKKKDYNLPLTSNTVTGDAIQVDVVFGGRREFVTSKNFQGGKVSATFGGAEINLIQADFGTDVVVLELRATFGGIELIVPAHWVITNEMESAFGAVEDQRRMHAGDTLEGRKTLVLRGSCTFGGVEIKSF